MAYISEDFGTSNPNIKFRIIVDLLSQSTEDNTSYINVKIQAWRTNSYETNGSGTCYSKVNGPEYAQSITPSQVISYYSYTNLFDANFTIPHNTDGTKSFTVEGYFDMNTPLSGGWNGLAVYLPTIPRASTISSTNADIEELAVIAINRASSSFKHTIKYSFRGNNGTIATNVDTGCNWTIPNTFYAIMTDASSDTCVLTCETYLGAELIGTKTCNMTISVNPTTNRPDVSATVTDTNSTTLALTGSSNTIVKYFSNARTQISATAKNSATISSYLVNCSDGKSANTADSTLNAVEGANFTAKVTDSRGITNTASHYLNLVDYVKLTCNATLYRTSPTNNQIALECSGNYFNGDFGVQVNTLTLKYRYREKGTSTWSSYTTITATKNGNTYTYNDNLSQSFDYTKTFEFQVVVYDLIYTSGVTSSQDVSNGIPVINWGKDYFNVTGSLKINDTSIFSKIYPIGSLYISTINTNPSTYFGGTWIAFGIGRTLVGVDSGQTEFNTVEETGGSKTSTQLNCGSTAYSLYATTNGAYYDRTIVRTTAINSSHGEIDAQISLLQPYITVYMWKRTA